MQNGRSRGTRGDAGRRTRPALVCALALAALLGAGGPAAAQGARGYAETTAHYVRLPTMKLDSVPRSAVTEAADGTLEYNGQAVSCVTSTTCTFYVPGPVESASVLTEDVSFTAWGLGVQGLSATGFFRSHAKLGGSDLVWPQSTDGFDAILGYLELDRPLFRIRLGRQQDLSGLGFSGYDGLDVMVTPGHSIDLEAYGGRSLTRGLDEPRNEALQGLESFLPNQGAYLVGGAIHAGRGASGVDLNYQRVIWANRGALVSERASLEGRLALPMAAALDASVDYDLGFGHFGKAHLTLRLPLDRGRIYLELTGRRYVPYFELWTIWGYFSPVGYDEGTARVNWSPLPSLGVWASAGTRSYDPTNAPIILVPLKQHSDRFSGGLSWRPFHSWSIQGSYQLERGFGAYLNNGDLSMRWSPSPRFSVSAYGTIFQQIEEFEVGSGAVAGGGLSFDASPVQRLHLQAGATMYRNVYQDTPSAADWNQLRLWTALRLAIGRDPGLGGGIW